MDPITHGALGACCAQALLYKEDKGNAWLVGALAAMAPDLDIFIRSSSAPMFPLLYHRHFTHSLSFIPLGAVLVALVLMLFKRFRVNWCYSLLAAFTGYSTHGLLDACTNYGTLLLWPFSDARINWDIIAIIDPFFTFPLILGLAWTLILGERRGVYLGLALAGLFLLFNTAQHYRALLKAESYSKEQDCQLLNWRVFPELASSTTWRAVAKTPGVLKVADVYTPLSRASTAQPVGDFPLFQAEDLPASVKETPGQLEDFTIFNWFTSGYLILAGQEPLVLADGRFLAGQHPTFSLWGIQFLANHPHVKFLNLIRLEEQYARSPACHW